MWILLSFTHFIQTCVTLEDILKNVSIAHTMKVKEVQNNNKGLFQNIFFSVQQNKMLSVKWGEVHDERIVLFLGWTIPLSLFDDVLWAAKSNNLTIFQFEHNEVCSMLWVFCRIVWKIQCFLMRSISVKSVCILTTPAPLRAISSWLKKFSSSLPSM